MGLVVLFPKKKKQYGKFTIQFDGLEDGSNPTENDFELSLESVDYRRKVFCRRQTQCLNFAASQNWTAYHCADCEVAENMSVGELHSDMEGLAMLLQALDLFPRGHLVPVSRLKRRRVEGSTR
jgi:hypothetical protein